MASAAGGDAGSDLTLLQKRSAGTFSTVYVAESRSEGGLARIVAVKHLKERWNGTNEVLDRTRDEARLLSRLQHKNILRVEALISLKGRPAVVMEFVDGVDVKQLYNELREQSRSFPPRAVFRIGLNTASALDAAWNQVPFGAQAPLRVVHRDIKPSNLMVSKEGEVKVLDFGTARFNHEARVAHTAMLRFGSLRYMSPERKEGSRGDHPGDVYALGLLMIELLVGNKSKNLPVDRAPHDSAIAKALSEIDDTGLPDERWENTLFETLARMCAYDASERLTAAQCVPLLRAFAEQARGDSLEKLASEVVAPLADQTFGRLGDGPLPNLDPIVTPDPHEPTRRSSRTGPDNIAARPLSSAAAALLSPPAGLPPPPAQTPPPPAAVAHRPPPSHGTPAPALQQQPPPRAALPTPRPAPPPPKERGHLRTLIFVGLGAFLLVASLGAAGLGLWLWKISPSTESDFPTEEPLDEDVNTGLGEFSVSVDSDDSRLRWIKVVDSDGEDMGRGRPAAELTLPLGVYTLQASVVGRAVAEAEFELVSSVDWICTPQDEGSVVCEADERRLLLAPRD